jgi:hypothetical protein
LNSLVASKHLVSLLTTDNASGKLLIIFIFSCCQFPFCESPKHTTALHYRHNILMYCTSVLSVNQHFPGLPASGTHCISNTPAAPIFHIIVEAEHFHVPHLTVHSGVRDMTYRDTESLRDSLVDSETHARVILCLYVTPECLAELLQSYPSLH